MTTLKMASPVPVDYTSSFLKNAVKTEIRARLVDQKANACPMGMRVAWCACAIASFRVKRPCATS